MRMGEPTIAQKLVKGMTNMCFATFMLLVLVLTVIAVTYEPPDPWIQTGEALSQVFSSVRNATFKVDDSVLQTGEDFDVSSSSSTISVNDQIAVNESNFELVLAKECDTLGQDGISINCSHPGVLAAIVSYNMQHLHNLDFFAYLTPMRGEEENQCDVAWRFRARREKSWRMYRDFRRFALTFDQVSCNYSVIKAYGWHSGKNARPSKQLRGQNFEGRRPYRKSTPAEHRNTNVVAELEVIDDSVPFNADEDSFKQHKYLFYSRGGDYCKTMNHYLWSFLCALGEAQYLNRTLVMDLEVCLSGSNNPGHGDEKGKDFRFYFDFAHLKDSASVMEEKHFFDAWKQWNGGHGGDKVTSKKIDDFKITPMQLRSEDSIILQRTFNLPEPNNYWYRVCEGETEMVIQRPWHLLWKSKRIMDIVNAICGQMEWDFDAVHVVRGKKTKNKELWPNLEKDTSVESIIEKLSDQIDTSRNVYIATNEMEAGYFRKLKEVYTHSFFLDDFSALWAKDSMWYNQTMELTGGVPVVFDGYMRAEVDTEVVYRAKKKIETFGLLTKDCKDGVNTC